jgi:hypothetical protein
VFWTFVAACRDALDRFEAEPEIASPDLRFTLVLGDPCLPGGS